MMGGTVAGGDTLGSLLTLVTDPNLFAARLEQLRQQMKDADASIKDAQAELTKAKTARDDVTAAANKLAQEREAFTLEASQTRSAQIQQQSELGALATRLSNKEAALKAAKDAHEESRAAAQTAIQVKTKELDELAVRLSAFNAQLDEHAASLNDRAAKLADSEKRLAAKHAQLRSIINEEPAS